MEYMGPIAQAVAHSLGSAKLRPEDAGAAALARQYAALIDAAQPSAIYARHLAALKRALDALADMDVEGDYLGHFDKITAALSAHSVASDLGPKLLAVLASLGLTVAGRGSKGGDQNASVGDSPLDELRARRTTRTS